jgi:hypothetical protein
MKSLKPKSGYSNDTPIQEEAVSYCHTKAIGPRWP